MNAASPLARAAKAAAMGAAFLLLIPAARATESWTAGKDPTRPQNGDFALRWDPGAVLPERQSLLFNLSGWQSIKALWLQRRHLDIGPTAAFVYLPTRTPVGGMSGTAWTFGGGLRLKHPHDASNLNGLFALSPWVDADAIYLRTGGLNRFGFAASAGLSVAIGESPTFWLGPSVRYLQLMQAPQSTGFGNNDAKTVSLGLSLEVSSGVAHEGEVVAAGARAIARDSFVCPDRDNDGVPDTGDRCPDLAGPIDSSGCPPHERLVIKRDAIELKEPIYFIRNQAILRAISFPVLDEVAQALKDNPGFRVKVEGQSSSLGADDYLQALSEKRAEAVVDYLVARGVASDRLLSRGIAARSSADTNVASAGPEDDPGVEVVVILVFLRGRSR